MTAPSPTPTEIVKPCPFCGADAESAKWITDRLSARCTDQKCYASLHWIPLETWNRRAPALAPFEKLVEEWRAEAELHPLKTLAPGGVCPELALEKCADRLSAVVEEVRGK